MTDLLLGLEVVWWTIEGRRFQGSIHATDRNEEGYTRYTVRCSDGVVRTVHPDGVVALTAEDDFTWDQGPYGFTTVGGDTIRHSTHRDSWPKVAEVPDFGGPEHTTAAARTRKRT